MNLEIDRNKLKVKHYLDIQSEVPGYPTREDFFYELVNLLVEWDSLDCVFGVVTTKSRLCTTVDVDAHIAFFDELEKAGFIRVEEEGTKGKYPLYKLVKHPWMKDDNKK